MVRIMKLLYNPYGRKLFFVVFVVAFSFVCKEASLADMEKYKEFIKKVSEDISCEKAISPFKTVK